MWVGERESPRRGGMRETGKTGRETEKKERGGLRGNK